MGTSLHTCKRHGLHGTSFIYANCSACRGTSLSMQTDFFLEGFSCQGKPVERRTIFFLFSFYDQAPAGGGHVVTVFRRCKPSPALVTVPP